MLTDNELILLGIETEMERLSTRFKLYCENFRLDQTKAWEDLKKIKDEYDVLSARHDALVNEVPF